MDRNTHYSRTRRLRRLTQAGATVVAAVMLGSAIGSTGLNAFATAVNAVADRYALPHWPRYAAADTTLATAEVVPAAAATPTAVPTSAVLPAASGARVLTLDAPAVVAAPLLLARSTAVASAGVVDHRFGLAPSSPASSSARAGLSGVAAQYHLPAPVTIDARAEQETSVLPTFRGAAVNEDGRTIELVDAGRVTPVPPAPKKSVNSATPSARPTKSPAKSVTGASRGSVASTPSSPATPTASGGSTAVLGSSLGAPVTRTPTPAAGDATGDLAYETVTNIGLGGPDGHSGKINRANRGTGLMNPPGTAGGVTYEQVVDGGFGSAGGTGPTDLPDPVGSVTYEHVVDAGPGGAGGLVPPSDAYHAEIPGYTGGGETHGRVPYETVVDVGADGSDGIRGATDPNFDPGDGTFKDVIVNADGSITVVPEPTGLLGLGVLALLGRRRR